MKNRYFLIAVIVLSVVVAYIISSQTPLPKSEGVGFEKPAGKKKDIPMH